MCLGSALSTHDTIEGEIKKRADQRRKVIRSLRRIKKGKNVSLNIIKGLRDILVLPSLTYGVKKWMLIENRSQAADMS